MDPITASTTFATVVGLICNFRQEKGGREALDHQKFIEWLEYHRHEDVKNIILSTQNLQSEIDQILKQSQAEIMDKLSEATSLLAQLVSRIDGLSGFAQTLAPPKVFSDQAISILEQLHASNYPEAMFQKFIGGFHIVAFAFGQTGPQFEIAEPLYAEDDLNKLADYGLLRLRIPTSSTSSTFYGITRSGVDFLRQVRPQKN